MTQIPHNKKKGCGCTALKPLEALMLSHKALTMPDVSGGPAPAKKPTALQL